MLYCKKSKGAQDHEPHSAIPGRRHVRYIQWAIDRYGDFHKITQHVFFDLLSADPSLFLLADGCNKTLNLTTGEVTAETICSRRAYAFDSLAANEQVGYPYGACSL